MSVGVTARYFADAIGTVLRAQASAMSRGGAVCYSAEAPSTVLLTQASNLSRGGAVWNTADFPVRPRAGCGGFLTRELWGVFTAHAERAAWFTTDIRCTFCI